MLDFRRSPIANVGDDGKGRRRLVMATNEGLFDTASMGENSQTDTNLGKLQPSA